MKKKMFIIPILGLASIACLTSCGSKNDDDNKKDDVVEPDTQTQEMSASKSTANSTLDGLVNPSLQTVTNDDLKAKILEFYNAEKAYIAGITDLAEAKAAADKVTADTKAFVKDTLKPMALQKLNDTINQFIASIPDEDLKASAQTFYNTEVEKISKVETLDTLTTTFNEIISDTKKFAVVSLKNKAIEILDPYLEALIEKIPYDTLKTDTRTFYSVEKAKLEAVDTIEGIDPCVAEIKQDLEDYALSETKKIAITNLDEVVETGLEKIPNETIKADLLGFKDKEIAKLNAVTKIEDVTSTLSTVISETEDHIKELMIGTVKDYLEKLTKIETATAYDYLPKAMSPKYQNNIVNSANIKSDFTTAVNVSDILKQGYGEQWQMVVENIEQSVMMANVFNVAQTALNAAGNAVNIYIENSYADEMSHTFSGSGYNGQFIFKNNKLTFNINIATDTTVPGVGRVKPIVKMEYDLAQEAKAMFISLGDSYKVKYVIKDNAYEMATNYGITVKGQEVSRSSYLSISENNGKTTGHIYEYTTYNGSDKIKACADFYVENGYVSVVGNKASGMVAFDGYVNELYKADEGRLLGYEVRESKVIVGVTAQYNTLWFNLWDISGINTVKVVDKTDANQSSRSTVDVYVNGSTKLFSPTYNSKFVKTSRKYDIELRSRFYYTYDSTEDKYVANEVEVPMMFIQEGDNFNSYSNDVKAANDLTSTVTLNQNYLNKILADYDTYIDIFIQNKENMSSEKINTYLEQYED